MRGIWVVVLAGVLLGPSSALAGNTDEVNAGIDVTLTGGAVVANVYTGASLWYNPAGIARSDKPTLELAGVTMNMQIVKNPGLLTIDTDPPGESEGSGFNFAVIPQAMTFTIVLKENLKLGVGLFNSALRKEFITEQAASPSGTTQAVEAYAGRNSSFNFFHISSGLAGEFGKNRKEKVLFGGAFDIVVATEERSGARLQSLIPLVPQEQDATENRQFARGHQGDDPSCGSAVRVAERGPHQAGKRQSVSDAEEQKPHPGRTLPQKEGRVG